MAETKAAYTHVGPGLPPLYGARASALILGSFPSPKSREQGFFYGHPQNRFWPLIASLTGEPVPAWQDIEAKKAIVLQHGLAVWDTIGACDIRGASDASIRNVEPNDVATLIRRLGVQAVFCNGAASVSMQNMPKHAPVCPPWCCPAPAPPTPRGRWTVCAKPGAGNCCPFYSKTVARLRILFYNNIVIILL